jgi:hypothetical protein
MVADCLKLGNVALRFVQFAGMAGLRHLNFSTMAARCYYFLNRRYRDK